MSAAIPKRDFVSAEFEAPRRAKAKRANRAQFSSVRILILCGCCRKIVTVVKL